MPRPLPGNYNHPSSGRTQRHFHHMRRKHTHSQAWWRRHSQGVGRGTYLPKKRRRRASISAATLAGIYAKGGLAGAKAGYELGTALGKGAGLIVLATIGGGVEGDPVDPALETAEGVEADVESSIAEAESASAEAEREIEQAEKTIEEASRGVPQAPNGKVTPADRWINKTAGGDFQKRADYSDALHALKSDVPANGNVGVDKSGDAWYRGEWLGNMHQEAGHER